MAMGYTATALSWHGVVLSEVARLSKREDVATNTGGVLAFAVGAQFVYPGLIGVFLGWGGDFGPAFALAGLPALVVGLMFLTKPKAASAG